MKIINIWALTLLIIGVVISIVGWSSIFSDGGGYLAIWFGYPLSIAGILLFIVGFFIKSKNPENNR